MLKKFGKVCSILAALALGGLLPQADGAQAGEYVVIVNAANPASGDDESLKKLIKRQFLKQQTTWPDNETAVPFARKSDSEAQLSFQRDILGMSRTELDAHWLRLKQTTGETPPREVGSTRILIRQVKNKKGAFGVIGKPEVASLPAEVRVFLEF